jgi:hypothetical protein
MATGRRSNAICDRCGFRCKYIELRNEVEVGVWVCSECFDGAYNRVNHPQNMTNVDTTDVLTHLQLTARGHQTIVHQHIIMDR